MSKIVRVEEGSIAYKLGIQPGDVLLSVNDSPVKDVFDYRYLIADEVIEVAIQKPDGEEWLLEIEKEEHEDLGLGFETGLMDEATHCANKCVFCFIDQLPTNMRPTLYFKDDDARLSFLTGNYITLTNLSDADLDRIIFYHWSPINISVHATDPAVRISMLKNPKAAGVLKRIKRLADAGVSMNFQAVLCKGINDGEVLKQTILELSRFIPYGLSLSVVPAGLTRYRDKLPKLTLFLPYDARKILDIIEGFQKIFLKRYNRRFVFAADEFYLLAGKKNPSYLEYEEFYQLENGVGMLAMFDYEFETFLQTVNISEKSDRINRDCSVVTGVAAGDFIKDKCDKISSMFNVSMQTYVVSNEFFGENITVSGLLTGQDIIRQLKGKNLGDKLLIPSNALRDNQFLDNVSINDVTDALGVEVVESKQLAAHLCKTVRGLR
ncbi:MAG: DUF512 domain-containing protein [Clostridiales bacterium]|nr:DUF512 domain-containing protein [Clostridiales bacterium]